MSIIMSIPREIRDQICAYVLFAQTNERPSLDESFQNLIESRERYSKPQLRAWNTLVFGRPNNTVSNAASLRLVNRQLNEEIADNMKLFARKVSYDLDIVILDEILLLPTWIKVPFLSTQIEKVNATFRIAGFYDFAKERDSRREKGPYSKFGRYKGFRCGDGAGPAMSWQIYSVLERFIRVGPTSIRKDQNEHRHIAVKTLNINVETPPGIDSSRFGYPRSRHSRAPTDDNKGVLDPMCLAKFITSNIHALLVDGHHEWFSYGEILFEHVDEVVISKDGEELSKFQVAEMLKAANNFKEKYVSAEDLRRYKEATWKARMERGLRVPEDLS